MQKRDIPLTLKEKQENAKVETLNKIQNAIDEIKEQGGIVTKKRLMDITGLSSGTFSKEHVKDLLKQNQVCQFQKVSKVTTNNTNLVEDETNKTILKLQKDNNLLNNKLNDKDIIISKLKKELQNKDENYQLILGKIHLIMSKLDELDIDIEIDFE